MIKGFSGIKRARIFPVLLTVMILIGGLKIVPSAGNNSGNIDDCYKIEKYESAETKIPLNQNEQENTIDDEHLEAENFESLENEISVKASIQKKESDLDEPTMRDGKISSGSDGNVIFCAKSFRGKYFDIDHEDGYKEFADLLRVNGYSVTDFNTMITPEVLEGYDVLVIPVPIAIYRDSEVAAIIEFVHNGGGLFLLSDYQLEERIAVTSISSYFGIGINTDENSSMVLDYTDYHATGGYGHPWIHVFTPHPIVQGLDKFNLPATSYQILDPDGPSIGVAWSDDDSIPPNVPVISATPDGYPERVVVAGDATFLSKHYFHREGNAELGINIINWLAGKSPSSNQPPVADAGPDQIALFRGFPFGTIQFVFFNGSNSYDLDGTIVDYHWDFGDGTNGSGVTTFHVYNSLGNYTVILTVIDDDGATDMDTAIITVIEAPIGNIFTDKYSYAIGELINITYGGPHGDLGWWAGPSPVDLHFIIKNGDNETVVEEPVLGEIGMTVFWNWHGTVNWEWNQTYRQYGGNRTQDDLVWPSGQQVPSGKYYVWFDTHSQWGLIGPAEFEIVDNPGLKINKVKISGADEVLTHTYNEWELKITVSNSYFQTPLLPVSIYMVLHKNASMDETVSAIESLGGTVSYRSDPFITIAITPNLIDDVAHLLPVQWMQKTGVPVPFGGVTGGESKYLRLKAGIFDPIYGEPDFLIPILRIDGYDDATEGYWIVQWKEQMTQNIWDEIEALGADIIGYIPDDAHILRMTNELKNEVANLSYVRAIVLYQPQYKLSAGLMEYLDYFNIKDANYTVCIGDVIVYDVLPAELELIEYELTQGTLSATKKGKGKMGSTHLTWDVGDLYGDAELVLKIATRKNPAGKQEFTSPGTYLLNEGAFAEGIDESTGELLVAGPTDPIYVTVW